MNYFSNPFSGFLNRDFSASSHWGVFKKVKINIPYLLEEDEEQDIGSGEHERKEAVLRAV